MGLGLAELESRGMGERNLERRMLNRIEKREEAKIWLQDERL